MRRTVCALIGIVMLCACSRVDTGPISARHAWTEPNVLRIADISDPEGFNPLLSTMDLVEDLSSLIFSYLVISDGRGRLIGDLATDVPTLANGGISPDGQTYTYRLRRGVRWSDGVALTSRDVAFTWRTVINPANNVFYRDGYDLVTRIDTPDATTVIVHLKHRYPPFVTKFFTSLQEGAKVILPAHLLANVHDINHAPFNAAPIGSGPFKVVDWQRGGGVNLVRNETYFKGRPAIDRIEFRVIPDDVTILNEVRTHKVDLVVTAPTSLFLDYTRIAGVKAAAFPWNGVTILAINDGKPGLRHSEVRQAIAGAIDYSALIAKVSHNVAIAVHDIVPPVAIGYTDNPPYRFDPAEARRLLERTGWRSGPDGIRVKNGERLDFDLTFPAGSESGRRVSVQLQANLRDIGIALTLKTSPYNMIFSYDGPIEQRRYDFALYAYTMPWDPSNATYLDCDRFSPKGENVFGFCDPVVDAGERAGLSTDDPVRRAAIYHPLERYLHAAVPYIPLYGLRRLTVINDDLKNFSPAPGIAPWWNAWRWSI